MSTPRSVHFAALAALTLTVASLTGCEYVSPDGWIYSPFEGDGYSREEGVMLDLPADHEYVVATTYLPIKQEAESRELFDAHMEAIRAQLDGGVDGLIGVSFGTTVLGDEVRTLTVWRDTEALYGFMLGPVHAAAMEDAAAIEQPGTAMVTNWTATEDELPPTWAQARERLDDHGRTVY